MDLAGKRDRLPRSVSEVGCGSAHKRHKTTYFMIEVD